MNVAHFHLTCANNQEAQTITRHLLEKRLVACVKMMPITSQFMWQGAIESSNEVLLIMESIPTLFKDIEHEVRNHHSYSTFVLTMSEVACVSKGVQEWIKESINQK